MKFDFMKPRPSLIYYSFIKELAAVREHGIKKYGDKDDWRNTEGMEERYLDAILRHVFSYIEGEEVDEDSGLGHLAHAACNLMFIIESKKTDIELQEQLELFNFDEEVIT